MNKTLNYTNILITDLWADITEAFAINSKFQTLGPISWLIEFWV